MNKSLLALTLSLAFTTLAYANPICPSVDAVKNVKLTDITTDYFGRYNLTGGIPMWSITVSSLIAVSQQQADTLAQAALSNVTTGSGPFATKNQWLCIYTPVQNNGYSIVATYVTPVFQQARMAPYPRQPRRRSVQPMADTRPAFAETTPAQPPQQFQYLQ